MHHISVNLHYLFFSPLWHSTKTCKRIFDVLLRFTVSKTNLLANEPSDHPVATFLLIYSFTHRFSSEFSSARFCVLSTSH